jgi:hypothetical protein
MQRRLCRARPRCRCVSLGGQRASRGAKDEHCRQKLSTRANVPVDPDPHGWPSGAAGRMLGELNVRGKPARGSRSAPHRYLLLGLASVPTNAVCRSCGRTRSGLAFQAPGATPRRPLGGPPYRETRAAVGNWVVRACRGRGTLGRFWLAMDAAAGDRADVHFAHRPLCVDRAHERPARADHAGATGNLRARAVARRRPTRRWRRRPALRSSVVAMLASGPQLNAKRLWHQERSMSINGPSEITAQASRGRPDGGSLGLLRGVALIAVVVGAAGSVSLMLRAGHPPLLLLVLFTGWVLSPFVALALADIASKRWSALTRATLYGVMLILTLGSLAFYGDIVSMPPGSKPAFVFLVVPLGSWLLLTIAVPIAALASRRLSRRGAGAGKI